MSQTDQQLPNASFPSISAVAGALWRHKGKAATFFLFSVAASMAVILWWPRSYSSSVELYVRPGRENLTLDPTATTGQTIELKTSEEIAVNSVIELLNSDTVAERVVDRFGAEAVLDGTTSAAAAESHPAAGLSKEALPKWLATAQGWWASIRKQVSSLDPVDEREAAIRQIKKMVDASPVHSSTVVRLNCQADSPAEAQTIASAVSDAFMDEYLRVHRTLGTHEFFTDQAEQLEAELADAVDELRREKNRFGSVSLEGQRQMLEAQVGRVEDRLSEIEGLSAATTYEISSLAEDLDSVPPKLIAQSVSGIQHSATDGMRQQLYDLEIEERELLSKYTDDSPFVRAIRKQRAAVEKILKEQPTERTHVTETINPVHQALRQRVLEQQARSASLHGEKYELKRQQTVLRKRLEEFNNHEMNVQRLQRRVQLLETQYLAHAAKLEQARIDRALEVDRISSINVLQPATYRADPVQPKKKLVLFMGLGCGLIGALGLALLGEYFNDTVRTESEVEHHLELPVFLSIPRSSSHAAVMC